MKNLRIRLMGLEFVPDWSDRDVVRGAAVLKGIVEVPNRTISGDFRMIPVDIHLMHLALQMENGDEFQDGNVDRMAT